MNVLLWIFQVLLGVYFISVGVLHFIVPPGLPAMMGWMYELSPGLHIFSGSAEILGGLGIILPGLAKIQSRLTYFAGFGLVLVMLGAIVWHLQRGELSNIMFNVVLAIFAGFTAYGRWRLSPIKERSK